MILSDSTTWENAEVRDLRDSLQRSAARVMVSGETSETAISLKDRLPWLLQPGVDAIYYDINLAGAAGGNSVRQALTALGHPATITIVGLTGATQSPARKAH